MMKAMYGAALCGTLALAGWAAARDAGTLAGTVRAGGRAVSGALVTARAAGRGVQVTVYSGADGSYRFPALASGSYRVQAVWNGHAGGAEVRVADGSAGADLTLSPGGAEPASSSLLAMLPEGDAKRKFALDCTGCHTFDPRVALPGGAARDSAGWAEAVRRMLRYAGADTPFPVIAADRHPERTAAWLTQHVRAAPRGATPVAAAAPAVLTEYDHPIPRDLPHDLAVDAAGQVVITGMMSDRMFRLDPATGAFAEVPIPHERANPRAVEIGPGGDWWVLLGGPKKIGRYAAGKWSFHDIGMYPHSVGRDAAGRIWFNGHFTRDPELIGVLDPATGAVRTFQVPAHPTLAASGGPVPYDLQVAPDGTVWGSELQGNRIFRFDPRSEAFAVWEMPTPHSGPRRMEFDARGTLWIPEYAGGALTRFDPATRRFKRYPLPVADALPYVVRVDRRSGAVWIGTGAADAVFRFDPAAERFTTFPLPTRGALIRHMAVDARTGDLWAAYGASPGIAPKILRVQAR